LKRFFRISLIITFVFSISSVAKDAFSFEPYEYADSFVPLTYEGMAPFVTGYRDSREEDYSVVEGEKWYHGTHSVQMRLTHAGTKWNILAKNHYLNPSDPQNIDTTFLQNLDYGDTIFYYLYIPWNAPIDSIFIFVRDEDWAHDDHKVYHARDLRFGRWNELKDGISKSLPKVNSIVQSDFEIHTISGVVPACTLYWDCPSSKGRVPPEYVDSTGQAGIAVPADQGLKITKGSINCVDFSMNTDAPLMVQVFDLTGRKQKEIPMGFQPAGNYNIPMNLAPGVYFVRIATDKTEKIGKIICIE